MRSISYRVALLASVISVGLVSTAFADPTDDLAFPPQNRQQHPSPPPQRSEPPPQRSEPPPQRQEPPPQRYEPPPQRSEPAPAPVRQEPPPQREAPPQRSEPAPAPVQQRPTPPVRNNPPPVNNRPTEPVTNNPPAHNPPPVNNRPTEPVKNNPPTHNPPPVSNRPTEPVKSNPPPVNNRPTEPVKNNPVPTKPNGPNKPLPPPSTIRNNPISSKPGTFHPPTGKSGQPVGINPARAPQKGQTIERPTKTVVHKGPAELDNVHTKANLQVASKQVAVIKRNARVGQIVNRDRAIVVRDYNPAVRARWAVVNHYYNDYGWRHYYHGFYGLGFYGGFYYPLYPCYDVSPYLVYPSLYWFYVANTDPYYWSQWYPGYYDSNPVEDNPYVGVYYPNEAFNNLGIETLAYSAPQQYTFRHNMRFLIDSLVYQLSEQMGQSITLSKNQVTVSHYQNLDNQAYVVEGFVDVDYLNLHVSFKAFIDLNSPGDMNNPGNNLVFVPTGDTPSPADSATLDLMNQRIQALGGNPFEADVEAGVPSN